MRLQSSASFSESPKVLRRFLITCPGSGLIHVLVPSVRCTRRQGKIQFPAGTQQHHRTLIWHCISVPPPLQSDDQQTEIWRVWFLFHVVNAPQSVDWRRIPSYQRQIECSFTHLILIVGWVWSLDELDFNQMQSSRAWFSRCVGVDPSKWHSVFTIVTTAIIVLIIIVSITIIIAAQVEAIFVFPSKTMCPRINKGHLWLSDVRNIRLFHSISLFLIRLYWCLISRGSHLPSERADLLIAKCLY